VQARALRRAPTTLAGDDVKAALCPLARQDRLEDPQLTDALRELVELLLVEDVSRLPLRRVQLFDARAVRFTHDRRSLLRWTARQQRVESTAQSTPFLWFLHGSFPSVAQAAASGSRSRISRARLR
jgi:hypothetical protein